MCQEIDELILEINTLKKKLTEKQAKLTELLKKRNELPNAFCHGNVLSRDECVRYSRQMLIAPIGIQGQAKLRQSKILIIGAGGLGCPAALYLTAAGIGQITLVDYDTVELSNLHRQILHSECTVGENKVTSAQYAMKMINSNVNVVAINLHANSETISELMQNDKFDVVIDCSDNVATRYLLNDVCVLNNVPLVSGSALQLEGQLTVYNYNEGPCYRCLYPVPPPPESVTSCGDGGVLGVVPGVIGVLQALEAIKIILQLEGVLHGRLLLFDGSLTTFRNVKLRNKDVNCKICSENRTIHKLIDYEEFCGASAHDKVENIDIIDKSTQVTVESLKSISDTQLIIDVRPRIEFEMCKLPNTCNFPFAHIQNGLNLEKLDDILHRNKNNNPVLVLCRRGNDSQRAIRYLVEKYQNVTFYNVKGGLHEYANSVDCNFPVY